MAANNVGAGEAGHQGQDRQPVKDVGKKVQGTAPEGEDVAGPGQVHGRSEDAAALEKSGAARKDQLKPGPEREEAQKSKGNAHHNQHETEPEMAKKVEKL